MHASALTFDADIGLKRERGLWIGTFTAMANPCEVLCATDDENLAREVTEAAAQEALRVERKFSRYRTDSVVHELNTASGRTLSVDAETAHLIDFGTALWRLSEGAFDISSGILRQAWRFGDVHATPNPEQIRGLLERVGWRRVEWRNPALTMPASMELDFGGIGKEYAVDRTAEIARELANIPMLINFGGDLRAIGPPPPAGAWQVGVESTAAAGAAENVIRLTTGAIATSGDTRRFIEHNGVRYGHILDARTGWPVSNSPRSVTVAADTCSQAGAYTTLAMLQGAEAEAFLQAEKVQFWCLR